MNSVRRWWQDLSGLVLPADCAGCGRARTVLCPDCHTALGGTAPRRVRPDPAPRGLPAVHAAAPYADEVRAVLLAHKERGALALSRPLGAVLAGAVWAGVVACSRGEAAGGGVGWGRGEGPPPPEILLVPVPSTPRATRSRGHDPVRRIARAAAAELRAAGVPARVAAVVRQRRPVADQAGLTAWERSENLRGALGVVSGGVRVLREGGAVVLVDDLMTTGASLAEAARAVRTARAAGGSAGAEGVDGADGVDGPVYVGVAREGRGVRVSRTAEGGAGGVSAQGLRGAGRADGVLCAAVVAAPPVAFEINRN
ncbi:ComF family protein [Streptomyces sp. NPDC091281]|uniref:ComF family protein n=1 Tax=Streptomyces sp. NPDC091281 TaxID=3365985 RepID=UPI0037F9D620